MALPPRPRRDAPVGRPTRGTTGTNRLRRVDRWIARHPVLRRTDDPLVVDLGFGASAVTALELHARLTRERADAHVIGLEIDQSRVDRANAQLADVRSGTTSFASDAAVSFARGGFEVPMPGERRPVIIRAFNVLRQYDESDVAPAWARMTARLQPGGLLVEGTCDEIGRVASWVAVDDRCRPLSLTLSLRLRDLGSPAVAAERLPKALIHRNVAGEPVHAFLRDLVDAWERAAPEGAFGPVHRWRRAVAVVAESGWPVLERARVRLGEVTVPWASVAPRT
ncbi:class I SAM-dependent methyltransferase [Microbacterium sp. SSW1-59]|uniref:class I SAM-dependent methyltransferase n=1 Tax=Microbacterium xanthum TaxID=3079794 RepID=UPI002AD49E37|nr:class I SAM-dependent methyltransferase [Microbacterium sp. SSW1-59]MDZ8199978.1 class I SAM-dependent methyltransferase [Microbacterium sp. SSW1-59]